MAGTAFLTVRCPACGVASDRVPASLAGRTVRCPRCSARFAVPAEGPGTSAAAVPPAVPPAEPVTGPVAALSTTAAAHDEAAPTVLEAEAPQPTVLEADVPQPTVAEADVVAPTVAEEGALAPTRAEAASPAGPAPAGGIAWKPGEVVLGLYEVEGVLGQGGMGRVYRVRHRGWDLDLAVKAPLSEALDASGGADLFEREAETWVNLGLHPHVVTCHYVRRVSGIPLVFAEYVDGGSLHDAIRARRLDSAEDILDVAVQLGWGLHHAHEHGLVHRDVKPANVMLTRDGLAKVTDFGLARARSVRIQAPAGAGTGQSMTIEGGGGGTPAYLSPEQAAGQALDRRSDLWAFGLCVLEAFLGGRTWEYGLAAPAILDTYRRDGLSAGGRPAMPESVADLLVGCFQERPEERPRDLAVLVAGLRAAWEEVAGRPYPRREPRGGQGSADALSNRAVSLVDLGRAAEATTLWGRALEVEPQHLEATYNAGLATWAEGRASDTELLRRLGEACASHGGRARAHQLLGRVHLALGQAAEALAELERAAALGGSEDISRDLAIARAGVPASQRTVRGLQGPVAALALSADGRLVAAGSGAEVRLWEAATGQLVRALHVSDGPVRSLALLPDGRFLLVGVENGPLALWDLSSGRPSRSLARHAGFATSLAVVPGGRFVASGGSDRVVRLWDPASGRAVLEMAGHDDTVTAVAAGRTRLASASRDGTVRVWALEDGRCLGTLRGHEGRVLAVALDESRARLVSAGEDATVRDWGLQSQEAVRVYRSHGQPVLAVALPTDGGRLVSGSADRTVRSFEADGHRLVSLARLDGAVHALSLAPDGTCWAAHGTMVSALPARPLHMPAAALCRPASASEEEARAAAVEAKVADARRSLAAGDLATAVTFARTARSVPGHERSEATLAVWDDLCARLPKQALLSAWEDARLEGHEDQVLGVAVDGSGSRALTAGLDATLRLWGLPSHRHEATLSGHDGAVTAVAFAGASRAVSGGRDRTVRLWDLAGHHSLGVLEGHAETVSAVDASADGHRAASASWDGTVRLWDLRHRALLRVLEGHAAHVAAVRLAPDGQVVASAGWDGTARLWDADSGRELGVLAGHRGNVTAIALHADGRQVATGGEDGTVRAWDARTRRAERVLAGHEGEITGLDFTPDGRFLLSGSRDHTVRVWDLRRGDCVRTLPHPAIVHGLARSPAAGALVTACADRCARVWHLDWEPEVPTAPKEAAPTTRVGGTTVRTRVAAAAPPATTPTLREDLRRTAPIGVPALPRAARAARRLPWGRVALALGILATVVGAWLTLRRPATGLRVSPHMARAVPRELDLIDLAPFRGSCSPGDYERHLERVRSGNPDARDVACLAAHGTAGVVADVLDGAPLASDEPLTAQRLRRNAASALAGLPHDAVQAVCARLGDGRADARRVAAMALAVLDDDDATACVRQALSVGSPTVQAAAAAALRQQVTRGRFPVEEAWALTRGLLVSPDPAVRIGGLLVTPVFRGDAVEPAVRPLLEDADPDVAASAREAVEAIRNLRKIDDTAP
jgi:WD40 repeat protein